MSTEVPFYLLSDSKQQPLLIKNPKDLAPEDADIQAQSDYLYLLPYTHQASKQTTAAHFPPELADANARPMVFDGNVFWTRYHALAYQQLQRIITFVHQQEDSAQAIADELQIRRIQRQCCVGTDTTLADPITAKKAIDAGFTQFCQQYQQVLGQAQQEQAAAFTLAADWAANKQHCAYLIRVAFVKQYPEVLHLYMELWRYGIIIVEQSDIDSLITHDKNNDNPPTLADTEIMLAILYNAMDVDFEEEWLENVAEQLTTYLLAIDCQPGTLLTQHCQQVGKLPIPYSNLTPGTAFEIPGKPSKNVRLLQFTDEPRGEPDTFSLDYLCYLHYLILDCEVEQMPALTTPIKAAKPAENVATPSSQSKTAKRLQTLLMSPNMDKGSALAKTPRRSKSGKKPKSLREIAIATPTSSASKSGYALTPDAYGYSPESYEAYMTPFPTRLQRDSHASSASSTGERLRTPGPARIITNHPLAVAYEHDNDQHSVKILFTSSSLAQLFRRRLINRYGFNAAGITLVNNSLLADAIESPIHYNFAVNIPVPDLASFWICLQHAQQCPGLFPHYGQAHLDLVGKVRQQTAALSPDEAGKHPLNVFLTALIEHQDNANPIASLILAHPHATAAYQSQAKQPFQPMRPMGFSKDEQYDLNELTCQYYSNPTQQDPVCQQTQTRMQAWFADLFKHTVGLKQPEQRPHTLTRMKSASQIPLTLQFNRLQMIDFIRGQEIIISPDEIQAEQASLQVHTWIGGERDALMIWARKHDLSQQVQTEPHADLARQIIKEKIQARRSNTTAKITDADVGLWFFVSSQCRHIVDNHSDLHSRATRKAAYTLPSIRLEDYADEYLQKKSLTTPLHFKTHKREILDAYILDSQSRYDALIATMNHQQHVALVANLEDVGINPGGYHEKVCQIKARCFFKALAEHPNQLQCVFFPVPGKDPVLWQALQEAYAKFSDEPGFPRVIIADVDVNAAFCILKRMMHGLASTPLAKSLQTAASKTPIAVMDPSPNYALPLNIGLNQKVIDASLLDSTKVLSQHPEINDRYGDDACYTVIKLLTRDVIHSPIV